MEILSLCLMLSTVNILPNRSQFFWYESISLSCEAPANSGNWTLKRNTSLQTSNPCSSGWGVPQESSCTIEDAYPSDTGVYWCESERGEGSNAINITVTDSSVILESPALPVTEGDKVALLCSYKKEDSKKAASNFSAKFYKDDVFIGTQHAGFMFFPAVSMSDRGFYKCELPMKGVSPQSWMDVKMKVQAVSPLPMTPPMLVCTALLIILYIVLSIVCVNVYQRWTQA